MTCQVARMQLNSPNANTVKEACGARGEYRISRGRPSHESDGEPELDWPCVTLVSWISCFQEAQLQVASARARLASDSETRRNTADHVPISV